MIRRFVPSRNHSTVVRLEKRQFIRSRRNLISLPPDGGIAPVEYFGGGAPACQSEAVSPSSGLRERNVFADVAVRGEGLFNPNSSRLLIEHIAIKKWWVELVGIFAPRRGTRIGKWRLARKAERSSHRVHSFRSRVQTILTALT